MGQILKFANVCHFPCIDDSEVLTKKHDSSVSQQSRRPLDAPIHCCRSERFSLEWLTFGVKPADRKVVSAADARKNIWSSQCRVVLIYSPPLFSPSFLEWLPLLRTLQLRLNHAFVHFSWIQWRSWHLTRAYFYFFTFFYSIKNPHSWTRVFCSLFFTFPAKICITSPRLSLPFLAAHVCLCVRLHIITPEQMRQEHQSI